MELKWQVAMISIRMKKFYKKTGRKLQFDAKEPVGFDKTKVECYNCYKTGHFAREYRIKGNRDNRRSDAWNSRNKDGRRSGKQEDSKALVTIDGEGVDWTSHSEEEEDYALMACNSSDTEAYTQDLDDKTDVLTYHKKLLAEAQKEKEDLKAKVEKWHNSSKNLGKLLNTQMSANDKFGLGYGDHRYDGILSYENEVLQSVFMNKESELVNQPLYDRFVTAGGMHAVPPPMTGNYMPSGPDVEIDYSQFTYGPKQSQPSESKTQTSDFDTCESDSSKPTVNEPKVVSQPKVWPDAPIIKEYASDSEDEHVSLPTEEQETPSFANQQVKTHRETVKNQFINNCDFHEKRMAKQAELNNRLRKKSSQREIRPIWNNVQRVNHQNQFVPTAVLTRTGKIPVSTAKTSGTNNVSTARHNFNREAVPTNAAMKVNTVKPIVNRVRPKTILHKTHSPFSRPFNITTALRTKFSYQKVNTAEDYPHKALQNKGIVDSGCSRNMTGNKPTLLNIKTLMVALLLLEEVKGRKSAKAEPSAHKDPLFDELPDDTLDYMDIEDAQDVGRIRDVEYEEKKTANDKVSTEDALSTDMEKVSTDRPNVSTDKPKVSTDKEKDSTVSPDEVLLNMSQAKAVSREKEKGVELKDVEETERPRPNSSRSLLTLKPLPKIDPKDKGKKKIEEEDESDTESKEKEVKKLPEEEAIKTALSNEYDFIQARIEANRLLALRLQDEKREQFTVEERAKFLHDIIAAQRRNQMMTYLKHVGNKKHSDLKSKTFEDIQALYEKVKRFDESITAVGSTKDERRIKEMNERVKDPDQKSLKKRVVKETPKKEDTSKVPAKVDVTEQSTKKRKGGHIKMIARKRKRHQPDVNSDDEHRKFLKIITFEGTMDSEIMERKSVIGRLDKVSSPNGEYLVIYKANGNFRAFNYLLEIMMESSQEENDQSDLWDDQQDSEIVTWRLYKACRVYILELKDGTVIHMLVEKRYPLSKDLLQRMLDLGLEVERESTAALDLIRFIKQ
ncbi:hypothetical protein Tco_0123302 [Tanacetum coccineum]